jgi:hypothetical protein
MSYVSGPEVGASVMQEPPAGDVELTCSLSDYRGRLA